MLPAIHYTLLFSRLAPAHFRYNPKDFNPKDFMKTIYPSLDGKLLDCAVIVASGCVSTVRLKVELAKHPNEVSGSTVRQAAIRLISGHTLLPADCDAPNAVKKPVAQGISDGRCRFYLVMAYADFSPWDRGSVVGFLNIILVHDAHPVSN
jgi:hypothetical protein